MGCYRIQLPPGWCNVRCIPHPCPQAHSRCRLSPRNAGGRSLAAITLPRSKATSEPLLAMTGAKFESANTDVPEDAIDDAIDTADVNQHPPSQNNVGVHV